MGGETEGEEERFVQKERVTVEGNLALRSVVGDREIGIGELTGHGLGLPFLDGKAQHQTFSERWLCATGSGICWEQVVDETAMVGARV